MQYLVLEELWADAETGKAVQLEGSDLSDAKLGRNPKVTHKLTVRGQAFTEEQVAQYGLEEFVLERGTEEANAALAQAKADQEAAIAGAREARIEALKAELAELEGSE